MQAFKTITRQEAKSRGLGRLTDHYKSTEHDMLTTAIKDQLAAKRNISLVRTRRGIEIWIPASEIKNSRNTEE